MHLLHVLSIFATAIAIIASAAAAMPATSHSHDSQHQNTTWWGSHDSHLTHVLKGLRNLPPTVESHNDSEPFANSTAAFHIGMYAVPHEVALEGHTFISLPLMAAPICVGTNIGEGLVLELTLDDLGHLLHDDLDVIVHDMFFHKYIHTKDLIVFIALDATVTAPFINAMALHGIKGFIRGATQFDDMILHNTHIRFVKDDIEVGRMIKTTPNSVGIMAYASALHDHVLCANIDQRDPITNRLVPFKPRMDAFLSQEFLYMHLNPPEVYPSRPNVIYPLFGTLFAHIDVTDTCLGAHVSEEVVRHLLGGEDQIALSAWGFGPLSPEQRILVIRGMYRQICSPTSIVHSAGSSATCPIVAKLSIEKLQAFGVFFDYGCHGSFDGLRGVRNDSYVVASTASPFTHEERDTHPEYAVVPQFAFAVSVVFNLGEVSTELTLSRCSLVDIFDGNITHWDDPKIQEENPFLVMPHERIVTVVRDGRSGTTEVFLEGLNALDAECHPGVPTHVPKNSTWPTPMPKTSYIPSVFAAHDEELIRLMRNTEFSIGYIAHPSAESHALHEAMIIDHDTRTRTPPSLSSVRTSVEHGTFDRQWGEIHVAHDLTSYPFAGVSYWVFKRDHHGNCTEFKDAMDFLLFSIANATAKSLARETSFLSMPPDIEAYSEGVVLSTTCDGIALYPKPKIIPWTLIITLASVGGAVLLGATAMIISLIYRWYTDPNRIAPKDPSKPICFMFSDIQSSTAMWARQPEHMGPWLDDHNAIIRECIAKHKCYEVKTIGDAFMVASHDVGAMVRMSIEIQERLFDHTWGDAELINVVYSELDSESMAWVSSFGLSSGAGGGHANSHSQSLSRAAPTKDPCLFNGLRVRLGLHVGLCEVHVNSQTGQVDYSGTTVNTAARVGNAGDGGQIVVTQDILTHDPKMTEAFPDNGIDTADLGSHELKGLNALHRLVQLSPVRFTKRAFSALRVATQKIVDSDDEDSSLFTNTKTESASKKGEGDDSGAATTTDPRERQLRQRALTQSTGILKLAFSTLAPKPRKECLLSMARGWRVAKASEKTVDVLLSKLIRRIAQPYASQLRRSEQSDITNTGSGSGMNPHRATADTGLMSSRSSSACSSARRYLANRHSQQRLSGGAAPALLYHGGPLNSGRSSAASQQQHQLDDDALRGSGSRGAYGNGSRGPLTRSDEEQQLYEVPDEYQPPPGFAFDPNAASDESGNEHA